MYGHEYEMYKNIFYVRKNAIFRTTTCAEPIHGGGRLIRMGFRLSSPIHTLSVVSKNDEPIRLLSVVVERAFQPLTIERVEENGEESRQSEVV